MSSLLLRLILIVALFVLGFSVLAALPARDIPHLGGMNLDDSTGIRFYAVDDRGLPIKLREAGPFPSSPGSWATVHDSLFVAFGSTVHRHDRSMPDMPHRDSWTSNDEILALADGPERGLILVLDRRALSLVRFPDSGSPSVRWSLAIDSSALPDLHGRLLLRNGNHVYFSDSSLPGVRAISIEVGAEPTDIASFQCDEGVVHDIALWGTTFTLSAEGTVVIADIGAQHNPVFERVGSYVTTRRAISAETSSRHIFVADGADLLVFENDADSDAFLVSPVAAWAAPSEILAIELDRRGRAYVLLADSWEVLDVSALSNQ
jgi:hypothetical protein